jgi:hypothetical protein
MTVVSHEPLPEQYRGLNRPAIRRPTGVLCEDLRGVGIGNGAAIRIDTLQFARPRSFCHRP